MSELDQAAEAAALTVRDVSYSFRNHKALTDVSFCVETGSIHGFVGPNGAGKTTTLKLVSTLLAPQKGKLSVFGLDVAKQTKKVRRRIGFMPDHFAMYRQMKVFEYLDFFAAAYGQAQAQRDDTIRGVLELTDMAGRKDDLIKGLSRGMQQRVSLARVLVHDPDLLLLDEPASGLDPRARIELMDILRELSRMGKTIFISSHILSELASLCDSVTIIDRGAVRYTGGMRDLLSRRAGEAATEFEVRLGDAVDGLAEQLAALPGVEGVEADPIDPSGASFVVRCGAGVDTNGVLQAIMKSGGHVLGFKERERQLDEAFMDLTEPGVRS